VLEVNYPAKHVLRLRVGAQALMHIDVSASGTKCLAGPCLLVGKSPTLFFTSFELSHRYYDTLIIDTLTALYTLSVSKKFLLASLILVEGRLVNHVLS
jgi:hypothetical protein